MGNLIWNELSRYIALVASAYAVWASFWGFYFRKFFWDFIGGILRNPGGLQPSPKVSFFITIIVKVPVVQILTMILGFTMIALEYPLPRLRGTALQRSMPLKVVLLFFQAFLAVLFYQVIPHCFDTALSSGDLLFFPSTAHTHKEDGIEFEIRVCPALQKKPTNPAPTVDTGIALANHPSEEVRKLDPFAPPYVPNILLGTLQDENNDADYVVLLNKYSVVPHHFVMVTKEFRAQTSPLMPPDLVQAYLLLLAARKANKRYMAFYNCGKNSGASQPHKHLQFIPVDDGGPPIERLARKAKLEVSGRPFSISSLPYANHVFRFPVPLSDSSPDQLEELIFPPFLSLLDLVISTVRHDPTYPSGTPSYNVILTLEHMHLIPRRLEFHTIPEIGMEVSVNSLGFAGMLLVKGDEELEAVKKEGVSRILKGVGVESVHDLQVTGTSFEVVPQDSEDL
ncbi:hypothetical protein SERLA73DRAFT_122199 [Serpula lacrymans var. lacrymans S7.3]|uniref:Uncharacterized protein n=2 Tax=Serpula lacrymans var. lacrymans TaxID=341189 RepID=F8PV30_SERL3|nr:uncharacterized protein SERLADRAFT_369076 [Serpula lacrymans var. lacrymans S7.9]EGO00110.1 hypothetical protein SERLA73DRAFT_122199 [Serpula lacrymans var. lacrymans S7.3]EGO25671.1 hypothetical protein SERLADRAFT_369076 [Serpula lacrymans var. lacrymans S7.9]